MFREPRQHVEGQATAAIKDNDPGRQGSITPEKPVFFDGLGIVCKAITNDKGAVINAKAHSMAGQDKRLVGMPPAAEGPWIYGRGGQPIVTAFGP